MVANIEQTLMARMTPAPARTAKGLIWNLDSKASVHLFVTKLNDVIMNELYFRSIKYAGADTVFTSDQQSQQIVMSPDVVHCKIELVIRE